MVNSGPSFLKFPELETGGSCLQTRQPQISAQIPVLHLVHWPRSGITSFLKNLILHSDSEHFTHHIVFFLAEEHELNWFTDHCTSAIDLRFGDNPLKALFWLRSLVNQQRGTIVHSHSFQPGIWGRLFHSRTQVGFLSTVHSPYPYFLQNNLGDWFKTQAEQFSINRLQRPVVTVSEAVSRHLLTHTRIKPELVQVIHNGLDTRTPTPVPTIDPIVRKSADLGPGERTVIAVGRLSHEKGGDILLRAWQLVTTNIKSHKLVIVGDGPELATLRNLARDLKISSSVFFACFQADIFPWLAGADLFVNSSRFEGFPMSILEAQLAGVPVVATSVGGVPEIIQDGVTGMLVAPNNPQALATAMTHSLSHRAQSRNMAKAGRLHVQRNHDIRRTVASYEKIYRGIQATLNVSDQE